MLPWESANKTVNIAVIGDLILDEYLEGEVSRISPEAPVPVHLVTRCHQTPGGAANAARNINFAGGKVFLFSVCGQDTPGSQLLGILEKEGIDTSGVLQAPDRHTTKKTRISAANQQMIRIDWEKSIPITEQQQTVLLKQLQHQKFKALLISDYGKGALPVPLIQGLLRWCSQNGIVTVVDPKGRDFHRYAGCTIITPNKKEAMEALGDDIAGPISPADLGRRLQRKFGLNDIMLTMGAEGMLLIPKSGDGIVHKKPQAKEVFDVSGAGDTVAAILTLALGTQTDIHEAMHIANVAAGIVVGKWGTHPVTQQELIRALTQDGATQRDFSGDAKIHGRESLTSILGQLRATKKKVVFTNGCFDILHAGHLSYLQQARKLGDYLVIGVNSDPSIKRLKGPSRPIIPLNQRMALLAGLACVDFVVPFDEDTPRELIERLTPDILVKGADYQPAQIAGADFVQSYGGTVETITLVEGISTSEIIRRVRAEQPLIQ